MTTTIVMAVSAVVFMLLSMVSAGTWVYKDARQRGLQAGMWTLLVVLSGNFIGLILYLLIGRKQERAVCEHCGAGINTQGTFCPVCGEKNTVSSNAAKTNKSLLFICIACIVLAFISLGVCIYSVFAAEGFTYQRQYSSYNYGSNGSGKNISQKSSGDIWELSFDEASGGYTFEKTYKTETELSSLSVDISCTGTVQLIVTQNGATINETIGEGSLSYDMTDFREGKINLKIVNIDASMFSGTLEIARDEN